MAKKRGVGGASWASLRRAQGCAFNVLDVGSFIVDVRGGVEVDTDDVVDVRYKVTCAMP